jgi:hypothetical protein
MKVRKTGGFPGKVLSIEYGTIIPSEVQKKAARDNNRPEPVERPGFIIKLFNPRTGKNWDFDVTYGCGSVDEVGDKTGCGIAFQRINTTLNGEDAELADFDWKSVEGQTFYWEKEEVGPNPKKQWTQQMVQGLYVDNPQGQGSAPATPQVILATAANGSGSATTPDGQVIADVLDALKHARAAGKSGTAEHVVNSLVLTGKVAKVGFAAQTLEFLASNGALKRDGSAFIPVA